MPYLRAFRFSRRPYVLAAYDTDFIRHVPQFRHALPEDEPVTLLLQLGWQHETPKMRDQLTQGLREAATLMPNLSVTVLCNSIVERDNLRRAGLRAEFCHQNAFLDERRFKLYPRRRKEFDAIYVARITPFKRHHLAYEVNSLRLIGGYSKRSQYDRATFAEVRDRLPRADYSNKVSAGSIPREIQRARCGLCLSAEEGAMFACAEYLLCGLPVVNTANIGGRDHIIPEVAVRQVPDCPKEVAAAVRWWRDHAPRPEVVRAEFLQLVRPHRQLLLGLLSELTHKRVKRFPHKLGLRRRLMPWERLQHGIWVR